MKSQGMPQSCSDQAGTLRSLARNLSAGPVAQERREQTARVISVTSGKGGVGKTAVVANVALLLARTGKRVLIIDADLGLANIDVVFGLTPKYNLNHFFAGERELAEIIVDGPDGIKILPAGSGVQTFTHLSFEQRRRFLEAMDYLPLDFDVVIIDTEAGISENVTYFNVAAQEIMVIASPEPTSITDAYALMKLLSTQYHEKHFNLIVNSVRDEDEALEVYRKLTMVSGRYLDISLDYLGCIPFERKMREAISRQKPIVDLYPKVRASACFEALTDNIAVVLDNTQAKGNVQFFWTKLLDFNQDS